MKISLIEGQSLDPPLQKFADRAVRCYWWRYHLKRISLLPRLYAIRITYFVRDYAIDGVFPIILALFAIGALYGVVDVRWIRMLAPMQEETL